MKKTTLIALLMVSSFAFACGESTSVKSTVSTDDSQQVKTTAQTDSSGEALASIETKD
jgi:hypothetical protein